MSPSPETEHTDTEQRPIIESLKMSPPEVIFVTSGSVAIDKERTTPTAFEDLDARGNLAWGHVRTMAAYHLAKECHNAHVVTLSTSKNTIRFPDDPVEDKFSPAIDATVAADEIRRRLTHAEIEPHVEEIPQSLDTFSEMIVAVRKCIDSKYTHAAIVTTAFQLPRAQAMLNSILSVDLKIKSITQNEEGKVQT